MTRINLPAVKPEPAPDGAPSGRRMRRRFGLLLAAAGVLLFGLLLFRILGPKPIPPLKVVHYTPQQTADAQKHMETLRAQLLATPPAAPTPRSLTAGKGPAVANPHAAPPVAGPAPVRMQLSQVDLNTYLATDPHVKALLASHGVQTVQILLREPRSVTCRAAILYQGRRANVQIVGRLLPSPDTVARFEAVSAQVGALPLPPKAVTTQANRIAAQFTGRMRGRFPITVQDIRVVGDHLVLTGTRRSPRPS